MGRNLPEVTLLAADGLKAVEGDADRVSFRYGFGLSPEAKALDSAPMVIDQGSVIVEDDGDLIIEGWAANFDGIDRQGENFSEGAFERGVKSFLGGTSALNYHHDHGKNLGKVLELQTVPDKGLWMKARVDKQEKTSPLYHVYSGVKKGSIRGLSVGGFFKRALTDKGWRIADVDMTEISVTPVPVHAGTGFDVIAGKALADLVVPEVPDDADDVRAEDQESVEFAIRTLNRVFEQIAKRGQGQQDRPSYDY